jgi:hypothetical protein
MFWSAFCTADSEISIKNEENISRILVSIAPAAGSLG